MSTPHACRLHGHTYTYNVAKSHVTVQTPKYVQHNIMATKRSSSIWGECTGEWVKIVWWIIAGGWLQTISCIRA
jgi:hypothetical protein